MRVHASSSGDVEPQAVFAIARQRSPRDGLHVWTGDERRAIVPSRYGIGIGGSLLDRGAAGPSELLHASARTRVTRLSPAGRSVIRTEPLGPDAPHRAPHEVAMLV